MPWDAGQAGDRVVLVASNDPLLQPSANGDSRSLTNFHGGHVPTPPWASSARRARIVLHGGGRSPRDLAARRDRRRRRLPAPRPRRFRSGPGSRRAPPHRCGGSRARPGSASTSLRRGRAASRPRCSSRSSMLPVKADHLHRLPDPTGSAWQWGRSGCCAGDTMRRIGRRIGSRAGRCAGRPSAAPRSRRALHRRSRSR